MVFHGHSAMDYTMEDTQNAAPDALEATKLNSSGQRNDTQSVTKRFVLSVFFFAIALMIA